MKNVKINMIYIIAMTVAMTMLCLGMYEVIYTHTFSAGTFIIFVLSITIALRHIWLTKQE